MAALFPPWSDTAIRVVLCLLAAAVVTAVVLPMIYVRTPYNQERQFPVDQPVQFDHRHHVARRRDRLSLLPLRRGARAVRGHPATEVCMGCHAQIWNRSPMLEPVRAQLLLRASRCAGTGSTICPTSSTSITRCT